MDGYNFQQKIDDCLSSLIKRLLSHAIYAITLY